MATWAIGDLQGCFETLQRLLGRIEFDPSRDRLWLVGDLVNRGPASLEVLRWARDLGDRVVAVLGNHDLHLLAIAAGLRRSKGKDTLDAVLTAPDRKQLLAWVRGLPLVHVEGEHVLVHAGLLPAWTVAEAVDLARGAEERLRVDDRFLGSLYSKPTPSSWSDELGRRARLRLAVATFTRMRACRLDGRTPDFERTGPPSSLPRGLVPWFAHPERRSRGSTVVFGHWAALDLHVGDQVVGLDSGCVWGRRLSAYRLEDGEVVQEPREP